MLLPPRQRKLGKMLSCWSHFSTRYTSWHAFSPEQHHSTTLFYLVVLLLVKTKSDIMRLYQRSLLTQFQCSGRYYLQTCLLSWIGWGNLVFFLLLVRKLGCPLFVSTMYCMPDDFGIRPTWNSLLHELYDLKTCKCTQMHIEEKRKRTILFSRDDLVEGRHVMDNSVRLAGTFTSPHVYPQALMQDGQVNILNTFLRDRLITCGGGRDGD